MSAVLLAIYTTCKLNEKTLFKKFQKIKIFKKIFQNPGHEY